MDGDLLVLGGEAVASVLAGRRAEVVGAVAEAYRLHVRRQSSLPHSVFLRFPGDGLNRIIALPAFLGDGVDLCGVKWVASFPGNLARGLERASAVVVLNSPRTGRAFALLEGSLISAQRTAASAALAARVLFPGPPPAALGLIGTGVINAEILDFVLALLPGIESVLLFDLDHERAARWREAAAGRHPAARFDIAPDLAAVLERCPLVSFATTAIRPHVDDLSRCPPGAVLLHVSLRDLTPGAILGCDNVVDDPEHVCRAQTSVHLAEQAAGNRDFIRCSLGELLEGTAPAKPDERAVTVFSPFGLGILDLAVAKLVFDQAVAGGLGQRVPSFFR
ncbi:MAG TPA: 2,3-diaminopropionate biosynthesis protein SbnB [Thermoanaerobaculia bacterium]|nr:2,3-diaminopropionate biosynthesis protein SbnB [Thermoanaerobaculia bacterium]